MKYILSDTCIVLHILRNKDLGEKSKQIIRDYSDATTIVLSVVTKGELEALSIQQNWGKSRKEILNTFLKNVTFIDISHTDEALIEAYALIDSYSKKKAMDIKGNCLHGTHRTMHKNDLWIAATAYILEIPLLTSDGDFDHLNGTLLNVIKIG